MPSSVSPSSKQRSSVPQDRKNMPERFASVAASKSLATERMREAILESAPKPTPAIFNNRVASVFRARRNCAGAHCES